MDLMLPPSSMACTSSGVQSDIEMPLHLCWNLRGGGRPSATLEATQGQMDGFFSQLPYSGRLTQDLPSNRLQGGDGRA